MYMSFDSGECFFYSFITIFLLKKSCDRVECCHFSCIYFQGPQINLMNKVKLNPRNGHNEVVPRYRLQHNYIRELKL